MMTWSAAAVNHEFMGKTGENSLYSPRAEQFVYAVCRKVLLIWIAESA
jgi:hypothetical protein